MDSITHALKCAIRDGHERQTVDPGSKAHHGLKSFSQRNDLHRAYQGAAGSDMVIELEANTDDVLTLWMEFAAAGFAPPTNMLQEGCLVILSPGHIEVQASTDDAEPGTWVGSLDQFKGTDHRGSPLRKAAWQEQIV